MTEQLTWQDALDPQLTRRLIHPLVQPGVIDTRMAKEIIVRSQSFNNRLPLLAQLQQRGVTKTTQPEEIPIVYAVPLPREASAANDTPALPTHNAQTTKPLVIQAKFASSNNSYTGLSPANSSQTVTWEQSTVQNSQTNKQPVVQAFARFHDSNDVLDSQLTQRLIRPLVQPGAINTRMAKEIIVRSQSFNHRLPLLAQLQQRGVTKTTQPEQTPIVYAVPLLREASAVNDTPALPERNSQTTKPLVIQAKFVSSNHSIANKTLASVQRETSTTNATTVQPKSQNYQIDKQNKQVLVQANFTDFNNPDVSPKLPIKSSLPLAHNGENSVPQIQRKLDGHQASLDGTKNLSSNLGENLSISPSPISAIEQAPIVYTQPLLTNAEISQSTSKQPDKQNLQISELPVVQAKHARPNNLSSEQSVFYESLLPRRQTSDISVLQSQKKHNVSESILSIDSATTLPKDSVENLLSTQLSVQQIPIVYAHPSHPYIQNSQQSSSQESQRPVVQVSPQLNSLLSHQAESLIFSANSAIAQQKGAVKSPVEQISNEYRETLRQGTQTATKLPFEGRINQINTNTIGQSPDAIGLSPITSNQARNSFDSENYPESKINLDTLADKLERKLMRRLVVESERRGQMRWR